MTYVLPVSSVPLPRGLTLIQFIQTVLTGVSGLPGPLVRPLWQAEPPKQPDLSVNWMAMGIAKSKPDANAYQETDDGTLLTISQRHELLEVSLSIYGPDALEIYGLIRDGLQIPNNLAALNFANMGFVEVTEALYVPELFNERFINRVTASVFFRRKVQRIYPILTIISSEGSIHTVLGDEQYLLDWNSALGG